MDNLSLMFSCCLSSDPVIRFRSEQILQNMQADPEFPIILFEFLETPGYKHSIRLFAAVTL